MKNYGTHMDANELAIRLGVTPPAVYGWVKRGLIPYTQTASGRPRYLFDFHDVFLHVVARNLAATRRSPTPRPAEDDTLAAAVEDTSIQASPPEDVQAVPTYPGRRRKFPVDPTALAGTLLAHWPPREAGRFLQAALEAVEVAARAAADHDLPGQGYLFEEYRPAAKPALAGGVATPQAADGLRPSLSA